MNVGFAAELKPAGQGQKKFQMGYTSPTKHRTQASFMSHYSHALRAALLALTFAFTTSPSFAAAPAKDVFPHSASDLKPDAAVRWGRLDNGLRYAILANKEPQGRASLRLAVGTGSLNETEEQRGVAHFLEHMAFNGSTNYPAGTLIEFFQRNGMTFGGDTNAFTAFDRTVYMLELPNTRPTTLDESLLLFSDYAGGLLLSKEEIDKERGIIMSEKRARDSVRFRQTVGEMEFMLDGTRVPKRMPIGDEGVIQHAPREQFVNFYNAWYRPERIYVVAVGDFDVAMMEEKIKKIFSPLKARGPAATEPALGMPKTAGTTTVRLLSESEAPNTQISIKTYIPISKAPDTTAKRLESLPRFMAIDMLNRRLSVLAKQENAPFLGARAGFGEEYDSWREAGLSISCIPEKWNAALAAGEQELRRALEHGFHKAELEESIANFNNRLNQAVQTAATRNSAGLADNLVGSFIDREVFTSPKDDAEIYGAALKKLTVEDCVTGLRALWSDKLERRIFITGNLKLDNADKQVLAAYDASKAVKVSAPARAETAAFAYTNFGPAGKVREQRVIDDLGITQIEFENGVKLNLKPTDFEAGKIYVRVRVGGGLMSMPADKPGLAVVADNFFAAGGLGKHSVDDLRRITAGKTVGTRFDVGTDAFMFGAATNRTDMQFQLQLLCAYLTDAGYRAEAARLLERQLDISYNSLNHTVEGTRAMRIQPFMASGDPRFGIPAKDVMRVRSLEELKAWLTPEFTRGAIEVAVVGDFDPKAFVTAMASTFGALPKRDAKPAYEAQRKLRLPAFPASQTYEVSTEIPRGLVSVYWPTTDGRDVQRARRLNMLKGVIEDRLRVKIREEMGSSYSPQVGAFIDDNYVDYGYINAEVTIAPEEARRVADAIKAVGADLQKNGVTDEELVRVKEPVLASLRKSERDNGYWLHLLSAAQESPENLANYRTRQQDFTSITAKEISALAASYLGANRVYEFISVPDAKGVAGKDAKEVKSTASATDAAGAAGAAVRE